MIRENTTERGLSRRRKQDLLRDKAAPAGRQRGTSTGRHATAEESGLELLQEYLAQQTGGREAPAAVRKQVEASLGRGLPAVRMHNDPVAAAIVEQLGARAITVGSDILFGHNELNLSSSSGWQLVAHELMHVAEQPMRFDGAAPLTMGGANDVAEHAADMGAHAAGRPVQTPTLSTAAGVVRAKRKGPGEGVSETRSQEEEEQDDLPKKVNAVDHLSRSRRGADMKRIRAVTEMKKHLRQLFPGLAEGEHAAQSVADQVGSGIQTNDRETDDDAELKSLVDAFQRTHMKGATGVAQGTLNEATLSAIFREAYASGADVVTQFDAVQAGGADDEAAAAGALDGESAKGDAAKTAELKSKDQAPLGNDAIAEARDWYAKGGRTATLLPHVPEIAKALGLDGKTAIDDELVQAVARFQKQLSPNGKDGVDGKIGPNTLALLKKKGGLKIADPEKKTGSESDPSGVGGLDATKVWPKSQKPAEQFDHWSSLMKKSGLGPDPLSSGRPVLIGLRGLSQGADKTHQTTAKKAYDDTFVMLWTDEKGKKQVWTFKGATHPFLKGNNKYGGVAMIKGDTSYDVNKIGNQSYYGYRAPLVTKDGGNNDNLPAYRQKNRDGDYNDKGENKQTTADEILFHPGYDTKRRTKNTQFSSIGCQTANGKDIERMTGIAFDNKERGADGKKGFDYVLLNGATAVKAAGEMGEQEKKTVRRHGRGGDAGAHRGLPKAQQLMARSAASARPAQNVVGAMQSVMGLDVSHVRLHTGSAAAQASQAINAEAFSVGTDVYFGSGSYQPGTERGMGLLLHELAHTGQPDGGGVGVEGSSLKLGAASSTWERKADRAAADVMGALRDGGPSKGGARRASGAKETIRRKEKGGEKPKATPTKTGPSMTDRIVNAIANKETGGTAVESRIFTSSGTKASYKSKVQATAPWAVTQLKKDAALRKQFDVTIADLSKGETRMVHAGSVWKQAMKSGTAESDAFTKKHEKTLTAAGLTKADVAKMLKFRDFKNSVANPTAAAQQHVGGMSATELWKNASEEEKKRFGTQAAVEGNAKKLASLKTAMASRMKKDIRGILGRRAGLDDVSWKAYMKRALAGRSIWAEDRAAWQRVALERVDGTGAKVKSAAEDNGGLTMGNAGISKLVRAYLAANPKATAQQALTYAAGKHNPGEAGYAADAWKRYVKLYGSK